MSDDGKERPGWESDRRGGKKPKCDASKTNVDESSWAKPREETRKSDPELSERNTEKSNQNIPVSNATDSARK